MLIIERNFKYYYLNKVLNTKIENERCGAWDPPHHPLSPPITYDRSRVS